ncbi:MAG TPA: glycosyl hydrolase family 28-related protein [Kofleriaceae bacterium]|nr:glycosyl hydrolase family 28-related protein [Kofleriaceae bacterium]
MRALALVFVVGALGGVARAAPPSVNVRDFGATGDGTTDDREAIQAAIDAAATKHAELVFPAGTFVVSGAPSAFWNLDVPGGVKLRGAGEGKTILRQLAVNPSVRLLHVSGERVVIEQLTLDGNAGVQSKEKNLQRHGIFAIHTTHLTVRHVTAQNFAGDGFYLYDDARHSQLTHVTATGNQRNGITLGGNVDQTSLVRDRFAGNRAQQVDSEPGGPSRVTHTTIADCDIDVAGASNDYALTVSGTPKAQGSDWTIVGNRIHGGIFVVWADRVFIGGNTGVNPTTKASASVYRTAHDVMIMGNHFEMTQQKARSLAGILIQGTGTGSAPDRVLVVGNSVKLGFEQSFGIRAEGAIDVQLIGNQLEGPGRAAPGYAGIYLRATNPAEDFQRAIVRGNVVRNFGARGLTITGNGASRLNKVEIRGNTFDDDTDSGAMAIGMSLDDGAGAAQDVEVAGNKCLRGVKQAVTNVPRRAAAKVMIDGQPPAPQ